MAQKMAETGGIITTYIFKVAFRQFWEWWTLRLGEVLPRSLLSRVGVSSRLDYREMDAGDKKITDSGPGESILIRLPAKDVLIRSTRYPFQAMSVIPDLLVAEVDRFTPFGATEVALAHRVVEYDWAAKEITVLFAAIRRKALGQFFEQALAAGHVPAGAVIHENGVPLYFSEPGSAGAPSQMPARLNRWAVAALLLFVVILGLPALMMDRQHARLSARLTQVQASAEAGAGAIEQANRIENTRQFVVRRLGEAVPPLVLLSELSRLMPQESWITTLNLQGNKLTLQGNAAKASDVVTALSGSLLLSQVQYQSSITRDRRTGLERFSITAAIDKGRAQDDGGAGK